MYMYQIKIKHPNTEELEDRGKIKDYSGLIKILSNKEVERITNQEVNMELKHAINVSLLKPIKETHFITIGDICIDCISNGYRVTTLVFYF